MVRFKVRKLRLWFHCDRFHSCENSFCSEIVLAGIRSDGPNSGRQLNSLSAKSVPLALQSILILRSILTDTNCAVRSFIQLPRRTDKKIYTEIAAVLKIEFFGVSITN